MSSFVCPTEKTHPLRFEFNGRGKKAYCTKCKIHFVLYTKRGSWTVLPAKEKADGPAQANY